MKYLQRLILSAAILILPGFTSIANAHFIWIEIPTGESKAEGEGEQKEQKDSAASDIKAYFSEGTHADNSEFLAKLTDLKLWQTKNRKNKLTHKLQTKDEDGWFSATATAKLADVSGECLYGVFGRGERKMLLHYSARYISCDEGAAVAEQPKPLKLNVQPKFTDGKLTLTVHYSGKPLADCKVNISDATDEDHEITTDKQGVAVLKNATAGRYHIRAGHKLEDAGTHDGSEYSEKSFYSTLVIDFAKRTKTPQ